MNQINYKIAKLDDKTWRIENIFVYSFLLVGDERAIMIDSGCSIENMKDLVVQILNDNGFGEFANKPIEVITTHGDGDHTNCHNQFSAYYVTKDDYEIFKFAEKYPYAEYKEITDGQIIDIGNRPLKLITVPGHTKGSIAILDVNNRRLFCGDMVQTGRIFQFGEARINTQLRNSYEKLERMANEFDEICPNHASPILKPDYIGKVKKAWDDVQAGKIKPELRVPDENEWPEGFLIKAYDCGVCTFLLPRESTLGETDMDNKEKKNSSKGFHAAVIAILAAIFVLLAIVVGAILPRTIKMMDKVNEELVTMETIIDGAQITVENVNKVDFDALSDSVNSLQIITEKVAKIFSFIK